MMTKRITIGLGLIMCLTGLIGFFRTDFLGLHLSTAHNLILLTTGALAIYFGQYTSAESTRALNIVLGVSYLSLGAAGYVLGIAGTLPPPTTAMSQPAAGSPTAAAHSIIEILRVGPSTHVWRAAPGALELNESDHTGHILLGIGFLVAGVIQWRRVALPMQLSRTTTSTTASYAPTARRSA